MDILENGRMIGFDGLYKFRFIDLFDKLDKFILKFNRRNNKVQSTYQIFVEIVYNSTSS